MDKCPSVARIVCKSTLVLGKTELLSTDEFLKPNTLMELTTYLSDDDEVGSKEVQV